MKNLQAIRTRLQALWKDEKQRANLLMALGMAGMLLLALSEWLPPRGSERQTETAAVQALPEDDYAAVLEKRLQALLSHVEGVGPVEVMVTLAAGEETVYAQDRQTGADGAGAQTHVLLPAADAPALVERTLTPAVQGVAVVCGGGASAVVQSRITQIVDALTGVGASHITVTPMVTPE